ncbi:MAG TPA: recombinase family protein, partial [Pyrinomonadaceae bacterium]|nr:recombinase family protein [Pyrinomonadaceae bacterium]
VGEIFAAYLEPQTSIRAVGVRIQALGVPAPAGKTRWNVTTIRNILTNPVYMGRAFACRTRAQMPCRRASPTKPISKSGRSSAIAVTREHWIEVGRVPAIVTEEQFEMVQTKLSQANRFAKRNNSAHQYLLRSLISCGLCNLACSGRSASGIRYYMCVAKRITIDRPRDERCQGRYIPAQPLEELVWRDLCDVIQTPELITSALERAQSGDWLPQQLQARRETLRKGRVILEHQLERLTEAYLGMVVPLNEYGRRRSEIEQKMQSLDRQQQMVAAQAKRQLEIAELVKSVEGFCQRVRDGLASANFEQKRQLLGLLIDRVVVTHEVVETLSVASMCSFGLRSFNIVCVSVSVSSLGRESLRRSPGVFNCSVCRSNVIRLNNNMRMSFHSIAIRFSFTSVHRMGLCQYIRNVGSGFRGIVSLSGADPQV